MFDDKWHHFAYDNPKEGYIFYEGASGTFAYLIYDEGMDFKTALREAGVFWTYIAKHYYEETGNDSSTLSEQLIFDSIVYSLFVSNEEHWSEEQSNSALSAYDSLLNTSWPSHQNTVDKILDAAIGDNRNFKDVFESISHPRILSIISFYKDLARQDLEQVTTEPEIEAKPVTDPEPEIEAEAELEAEAVLPDPVAEFDDPQIISEPELPDPVFELHDPLTDSEPIQFEGVLETFDSLTNPNPVFEGTVSEFIEPDPFGISGSAGTVIEPIDGLQGSFTDGSSEFSAEQLQADLINSMAAPTEILV